MAENGTQGTTDYRDPKMGPIVIHSLLKARLELGASSQHDESPCAPTPTQGRARFTRATMQVVWGARNRTWLRKIRSCGCA